MNITTALTAAAVALGGTAVAVAAGLWTGREHRRTPAPLPAAPRPAADAWLPCHTTWCGHMTTPHDRTAAGLTCRGCGTTTPAQEG